MRILADLQALNRDQRSAFIASLLGWALDAFDFFLMVFVVRAIAHDFNTQTESVLWAITLTLMFRPLGALFFGWLADHFGRRPILMIVVLLFSGFELASAFAPSLTVLLILRALFGFAMGGEWGIGSSLAMETIPAQSRGVVSGILQEGYPLGYLLASIVYWLFYDWVGWRGLFAIGVLPALLVFYIRMSVKESPVWEENRQRFSLRDFLQSLGRNWRRFIYVILLMTAFNFMSHGTQDVYPTFLQSQHKLSHDTFSAIMIIFNIGAIIGGVLVGAYSQKVGRRRAIITSAIFILPIIPLWAFSSTPLMLGLGAFLIQVGVQGAWGVVPAHLNELSPDNMRGTFPGFTYQIGNLIASYCAVLQGKIAAHHNGNYGLALASVTGVAVVVLIILTACGSEAHGITFGKKAAA